MAGSCALAEADTTLRVPRAVDAHSLMAFYKAFPELSKDELYLTGESYFGVPVPSFRCC